MFKVGGIAKSIFERAPSLSMSRDITCPNLKSIDFIVECLRFHLYGKPWGRFECLDEAEEAASAVPNMGGDMDGFHEVTIICTRRRVGSVEERSVELRLGVAISLPTAGSRS